MTSKTSKLPSPHFPNHCPEGRVWLITAATSPIGISLIRQVLDRGDSVIAGIKSKGEICDDDEGDQQVLRTLWEHVVKEGWKDRIRVVSLDGRSIALCQAAVAEAVEVFGKVEILFCCDSEAVIGTIEELSASPRSLALMRDQFETNFFGPVNIIKAVLPTMREQMIGHIIVLTGTTGHIGTPGLGMYCASGWALEGFCDSLAYEIAPFNIKMTIIQPNLEVNIFTNKITSPPLLPQYSPENHPAPLFRAIIGALLDRLESPATKETSGKLNSSETTSLPRPRLPPKMTDSLLAETLHAIIAIGGHPNPPTRHIVGYEGIATVKEKLMTVSEELEDFVEVSCAADIVDELDFEHMKGEDNTM